MAWLRPGSVRFEDGDLSTWKVYAERYLTGSCGRRRALNGATCRLVSPGGSPIIVFEDMGGEEESPRIVKHSPVTDSQIREAARLLQGEVTGGYGMTETTDRP